MSGEQLRMTELDNAVFQFFRSRLMRHFSIAFLLGLLANLPLLIAEVTNPDGIMLGEVGYGLFYIQIGRWLNAPIFNLRHYVTLPVFTSLVSLSLLSLSAILVVRMLRIESEIISVLSELSLVLFPTITQYLTYQFMSDAVSASILLSTCSAALILSAAEKKSWIRFMLAILALAGSLSIYQAMVGISICICISNLIQSLCDSDADIWRIIKKAGLFFAYGVFALAIYIASCKIAVAVSHTEFVNFRGTTNAVHLTPSEIPAYVLDAYRIWHDFYFTDTYYAFPAWHLDTLFAIVFLTGTSLFLIRFGVMLWRREIGVGHCLIALAFALIYPLACIAIRIPAHETFIDFKMLPHMLIPLLLCVWSIQSFLPVLKEWTNYKLVKQSVQWLLACVLCILCVTQMMISNAIVEAMKTRHYAELSLSIRILEALDNFDGYTPDSKIAILGNPLNEKWLQKKTIIHQYAKSDIAEYGDLWSSVINPAQVCWSMYFSRYHGVALDMVSDPEAFTLMENSNVKSMNIFPADGSISLVNGIVTVKLSDF